MLGQGSGQWVLKFLNNKVVIVRQPVPFPGTGFFILSSVCFLACDIIKVLTYQLRGPNVNDKKQVKNTEEEVPSKDHTEKPATIVLSPEPVIINGRA